MVVSGGPIPKLLRVSRQFKYEYEKQIKGMQVLTLTDLGGTIRDPALSTDLILFNRVEINLLAMCTPGGGLHNWYDGAEEISNHTSWTGRILAGLPKLEEVAIRLYIHWKVEGETKWPHCLREPAIHEELEELVGNTSSLSRLEIYPFFWRDEYEETGNRFEIFTKHEDLVALWKKEAGWVDV